MLEWLLHHGHIVQIRGDSYRMKDKRTTGQVKTRPETSTTCRRAASAEDADAARRSRGPESAITSVSCYTSSPKRACRQIQNDDSDALVSTQHLEPVASYHLTRLGIAIRRRWMKQRKTAKL